MRDPLRSLPVRTKLALLFVSLCVLAFGAGGWMVSAAARAAMEKEIGERLGFQSRATASALAAQLQTLTQRTQDFASDGHIRELVAQLTAEPEALPAASVRHRLLADLERHLRENKLPLVPAFVDLSVVDARGTVVASLAPLDAARAAVARSASGQPEAWQSDLIPPGDASGPVLLALAVPLRSLDGARILGRLVSWVHPILWVAGAFESSRMGQDRDASHVALSLIDGQGHALHLPRVPGQAGPQETGADLASRGPGPLLQAAPAVGETSRRLPIAATGWSVQMERNTEDDFLAVTGLQSRFLAVGGALAALSMLLMLFPLHFLGRPLMRMKEAARRIQKGDLATRVEVESQDEIGELAMAFNHMAEAVEGHVRRQDEIAADLRAQKAELRHESERLAAVIASMRDGLLVLDGAGKPVLSNPAGRPLVRLQERDGMLPTPHHVCREGADCAGCLFEVGRPPRACVVDLDHSVFEVQTTRLAPDEQGRCGRVLVARDITDRVRQDERHIHQERLAVIGEVAAVMAHEVNNPLAAIRMFAQMMAADLPAASPLREGLDVIQRNTETCKRAIRELLDYATGSAPEPGPLDVLAVLEDVARFLRPMRERAGVELRIECAARDAQVRGDEVQLRQVFVNLIVNALQAMAGRGGRIQVVARNVGDHLEVDIADSGPGIPAEIREQVFKPFFTTKPRGEGTGLGLSTARRICELHGGSLELIATGPEGTVFRVRLRAAV